MKKKYTLKEFRFLICLHLSIFFIAVSHAQTINPINNGDAINCINDLFGQDISANVTNANIVGGGTTLNNSSVGKFTGFGTQAGYGNNSSVEDVIVFSTGPLNNLNLSNTSGTTGSIFGGGGSGVSDNDFNDGSGVFDAAFLEFTINLTQASTISGDFVFSSDEYLEFVNGGVNDAARIFVNGQNYALAPNGQEVSIDAINTTQNATVFIDNTGNTRAIEPDGLTQILTFSAPLRAGANTIKIGIADRGDNQYDSWFFFGSGSFNIPELNQQICDIDLCSTFQNVRASADCPSIINDGFYSDGIGTLPSGAPQTEWIGFLVGDDYTQVEGFNLNFGNLAANTYTLGFYHASSSSPNLPGNFNDNGFFTIRNGGTTLGTITYPATNTVWQYEQFTFNHSGGNLTLNFDGPPNGTNPNAVKYAHIASVSITEGNTNTCASAPTILENTCDLCSDGIDNDGDGLTDAADSDCVALDCSQCPVIATSTIDSRLDTWQNTNTTVEAGTSYSFSSNSTNIQGIVEGTAVGGPFNGQFIRVWITGPVYGGVTKNGFWTSYNNDLTYNTDLFAGGDNRTSFVQGATVARWVYNALIDVNGNGQYDDGIDELILGVDPLEPTDPITPTRSGDLYLLYGDGNFTDNLPVFTLEVRAENCDENTCDLCADGIDNDGDGLLDFNDPDCQTLSVDTDGDGIPNLCDLDDDNDGILDANENCALDTDNDGINNCLDTDADGDGCPDAWEGNANFTDANTNANNQLTGNIDTNGVPVIAGANGQGIGTSQDANQEAAECIIPPENTCALCADGIDNDGDGLTDSADPDCPQLDSDNDGVPDECDLDDDNDGILDTEENCALDTDNDGINNCLDTDADGDGCPDAIEGDAAFLNSDLNGNNQLMGNVDANGVTITAGSNGQSIGSSQDANNIDSECVECDLRVPKIIINQN